MKNIYFIKLKKTWTVLLMSLMVCVGAKAAHYTVSSTSGLTSILLSTSGLNSRDTIFLDPSGTYSVLNFTIVQADTFLTFKPSPGSKARPKINASFKIPTVFSLTFDSIEFDGGAYTSGNISNVINYPIQTTGSISSIAASNLSKLKIKNCYVHNFAKNAVYSNFKSNIDSLIVDNSVFWYFKAASYFLFYFPQTGVNYVKCFKATNSTFSGFEYGLIRMPNVTTNGIQNVIIDHCTIDSVYTIGANYPITHTGQSGSTFSMTNSIFTNYSGFTTATTWGGINSSNVVATITNTRYYNIGENTGNTNTANTSTPANPPFSTITGYSSADPMYLKRAFNDYTLDNPIFFTASSTGGFIGDPRWAPIAIDAYLSDIQSNGVTVAAFNRKTYSYMVMIPKGTTTAPTVTYTKEIASSSVTQTNYGLDSTVLVVKSQNGLVTNKYKLQFLVPDRSILTDLKFDGTSIFQFHKFKYGITLPKGTTTIPDNSRFAYTLFSGLSASTITQAPTLKDSTVITVTTPGGDSTSTYKIGFAVTPWVVNATASPSAGGTITNNGPNFQPGQTVTLTAVPATGYNFNGWYNGATLVSSSLTYTFTADNDYTLTASFSLKQFNVTVNVTPSGTVKGIPTGTVTYGKSVTLMAQDTVNSSYLFVDWTSGSTILSREKIITFSPLQDTTINANFISSAGLSRKHHATSGTDFIRTALRTALTGDTIELEEGTYNESIADSLTRWVTIKAAPGSATMPKVFMNGSFNFYIERVSFTLNGIEFNGLYPGNTSNKPTLLQSNSVSCDTFYNIKVLNCNIHNFNQGIVLGRNNKCSIDTFVMNNVLFYDKVATANNYATINLADKAIVKYLSVTNSTFYNMAGGFLDAPYQSSGVTGLTTPMKFIIDHNTFYNIIHANKSLVQTNTVNDGMLNYTFTNNIVYKLQDSTTARPFWYNATAGSATLTNPGVLTISNNCVYRLKPAAALYSIDSLSQVADGVKLIMASNHAYYPSFRDTANRDFTLPDTSILRSASTTGKGIGDPRWVKEVKITPSVAVFVPLGLGTPFKAHVSIVGATDTTVTWTVVNSQYGTSGQATIDQTGVLHPTANGKIFVKAVSNYSTSSKDSVMVSLRDKIMITSISVLGTTSILGTTDTTTSISIQGLPMQLYANILPANADDQSITWSVINGIDIKGKGKATISQSGAVGTLIPVAGGIVRVKATANDGSGVYAQMDVTLSNQIPVTKVSVITAHGDTAVRLSKGTLQMEAVITPANADITDVVWSVNDATIATIDTTGLLTVKKGGKVIVTATSKESKYKKGSMTITVTDDTGIQALSDISVGFAPNPASDYIRIISDQKTDVTICDMVGNAIISTSVNANGIVDIGNLKPGVYLVNIKVNNHSRSVKLLKE